MPARKRAPKPPPAWRNRIVDHGVQAAGQFLAHPDNWRIHPHSQEQALTGVLDAVGWIDEVVVSKRTGRLLNGHLRVKAALARSEEEPVPYKVVDVTENEEALILLTFDPISALAGTDTDKRDELLGLLPDDLAPLAAVLHSDQAAVKKLVQFSAAPNFQVIVDCQNETQQAELLSRLGGEGYQCRTGSAS